MDALCFCGGWEGHRPGEVGLRLQAALEPHGIAVELSGTLASLDDAVALRRYGLFLPNWTMGTLSEAQAANLQAAVRAGAGLAGLHGGAGDAFRGNLDYEWMVGGHFVGHPHVGDYTVRIAETPSPITAGLPREIPYRSEQYYLLVDPGVDVVAEADYAHEGRRVAMPVAWTKAWGKGRIFYSSLGHEPAEFDRFPDAFRLAVRGILWAAGRI